MEPFKDQLSADQFGADQLSIDTPELVAIHMPIAGIGSRFIAILIDTLIWLAGVVALGLLFWFFATAVEAFNSLSYQWTVALYTFLIFLMQWGYFTLFEAFWNGQTPGKRVARIRVIQRSGRAIGLFESIARNFIRMIDQFPFCYVVGVLSVFATRQHQRLGDLAAGTLVVRDRREEAPLWGDSGSRTFTAALFPQPAPAPLPHLASPLAATAIARLTAADLEVMENFFSRRLDLPTPTRQLLAQRIVAAVQAKSGLQPPDGMDIETFLEIAARDLRDIARLR